MDRQPVWLPVLALALVSGAAMQPQEYHNPEFGITVPVPKEALLCESPRGEHDHGPLFLLGSRTPASCSDTASSRTIALFAGYNAADATRRLNDLLQWQCKYVAKGTCGTAPSGLQVDGLPSESGEVRHRNGWIDILVVTQAGKANPAFDPAAPAVNYTFGLRTTASLMARDLATFRTILRTTRLSPPGGDSRQYR